MKHIATGVEDSIHCLRSFEDEMCIFEGVIISVVHSVLPSRTTRTNLPTSSNAVGSATTLLESNARKQGSVVNVSWFATQNRKREDSMRSVYCGAARLLAMEFQKEKDKTTVLIPLNPLYDASIPFVSNNNLILRQLLLFGRQRRLALSARRKKPMRSYGDEGIMLEIPFPTPDLLVAIGFRSRSLRDPLIPTKIHRHGRLD